VQTSANRSRSLKSLLLMHELALLLLVIVTGVLGGLWAYFWQQTSQESLRLSQMAFTAHNIRTDLFRQIKDVTVARIMEDPRATSLYSQYSRSIDDNFNRLRQATASQEEELSIQDMQHAYRVIQQDMNKIFSSPYMMNRAVRMRILDIRYQQSVVGEFELAFRNFEDHLKAGDELLRRQMQQWTQLASWLIPLVLLLGFGLLLMSRRSLQRGFVRPMAELIAGAREISTGRLDHRISIQGTRELMHLAEVLNRMAAELAKIQTALVETERQAALGSLVPVIAHNIRNPLASIRASAQLLDVIDDQEDIEDVKAAVIETVDRLERWVSALVSYLHPLKPHPIEQGLLAIPEAALRLLQNRLSEKNMSVIKPDRSEDVSVNVDADLMEQAVYGLLSNAIDASPMGSSLKIGLEQRVDEYRLTLDDQGPGIPFEPVAGDLEPGLTTKRFGTGLGIPVAFKVCAVHGWALSFEALPGAGTRVTIRIPRQTGRVAGSLADA